MTLFPLWRRAGLVALLACAAVTAPQAEAAQVVTRSRVVAVDESARQVGTAQLRSLVELSGGGVGGLSGLWVSPDSRRFVAVADDGQLVQGRFGFDKNGQLNGVTNVSREPLLPPALARAGKEENDSEEIAAAPAGPWPEGGWLVSFERHHRILKFGPRFLDDGPPQPIPAPPELDLAPENAGVEALAAWESGALLALQEATENEEDAVTTPAWFAAAPPQKRDDWRGFFYRSAQGFHPSGATALPGGGALVLERRATWLSGFSARLVLVRAGDIAAAVAAKGVLSGREIARFAPPFPSDNFEGVAVVPGPHGALQIFIVSDDNYSPLQRTLFMHLTLPPNEESR